MSNLRTIRRAVDRAGGYLPIDITWDPKTKTRKVRKIARAWVFEKHDGELVTRFDERRQGTPRGHRWDKREILRRRIHRLRCADRIEKRRSDHRVWCAVMADSKPFNKRPRGQRNAEVTP